MYLYKYVTAERVDVLETGLIRFTPADHLNDRFELKPAIDRLTSVAESNRMFTESLNKSFDEQFSEMPPPLRQLATVLAEQYRPQATLLFKQIHCEIMPWVREQLYTPLTTKLGILSLTEDPCNMAMWAHYAQEGKGFVLQFDADHAFFHQRVGPNDDLREIRPVAYQQRAPKALTELDAELVLYSKTQEWAYEKEWRMVLPLDTSTEQHGIIHLFAFPAECLTGIVIGQSVSADIQDRLHKTVKSKYAGARIKGLVLDPVSGPRISPLAPREEANNRA